MRIGALLAALLCGTMAHAESHPSDLVTLTGIKFPNSASEGEAAVTTRVLSLAPHVRPHGYTELVPFALRSPDQLDAGSCLYMTLTGIEEWFLARLHPNLSRAPEGPIDLSERYAMNLSNDEVPALANWKTDSVYMLNQVGKMPRNVDYRFTKGWSVLDPKEGRLKSRKGAPGATYDTYYNWVDERAGLDTSKFVAIPKLKREVLFADPASDQWNTGVMPESMVEKVKAALRENKAPVQIIYNHFGYWHSNFIVGYDDEKENQNCRFVRDFMSYIVKRGPELRAQAANASTPADRDRLLKSAERAEKASAQTRAAYDQGGGCHPKGVFYVRDSIYSDDNGPLYDYDPSTEGEEENYAKTIVLLEYDWLRTMSNHAVQFTLDEDQKSAR